jgi:hypothetical protein
MLSQIITLVRRDVTGDDHELSSLKSFISAMLSQIITLVRRDIICSVSPLYLVLDLPLHCRRVV